MSVIDPIRARGDLWHTAPATPSRPCVYQLYNFWIAQLGHEWQGHYTWPEALATANRWATP